MSYYWTDEFSYVSGAVRYKDLAYLARIADEIEDSGADHYFPTIWDNGVWGIDKAHDKFDWSAVSVCVCKKPIEQGVFLGAWGDVYFFGSGDVHVELINCDDGSPKIHGPMRQIRSIEGKAYAVGMARQVYRRDGVNIWTSINQGAQPTPEIKPIVGFDTVDGFSKKEIYAAGRNGEIWNYNGTIWKQMDSPTNRHLTNMCCAGNELIYICGQGGVLIEGRNDQWRLITATDFQKDLWGLAWFENKLYVSSRELIYYLKDDKLKPVDMADDIPATCYHLSAADGVMWSIGPKDIMAFDGKKWTRID